MPEGPEVEAARRQLDRWLLNKVWTDVSVLDEGLMRPSLSTRPSSARPLDQRAFLARVGHQLVGTHRSGKRLGLEFSDGVCWLHHLGMTGKWVRQSREQSLPRHARLVVGVEDQRVIYCDTRRFGGFTTVRQHLGLELAHGHGPDLLKVQLDGEGLKARFAGRRAIKEQLLDQKRVAGVGNIHAVEALFRAGILPTRDHTTLTMGEWGALARALFQQLRETVDLLDHDDLVYVSEGGPNPFLVYGKVDCPTCKRTLESIKMSGRTTSFCAGCQS